jgi:hypothetical protein
MKKLVSCFAVASLLGLGSSAIADLCTIEATPAATLLLPYFEVNIDDPNGIDTFFSINNASAASVLTHVIVWTDLSVEALDFNIYLTGYDVQTVGMGLIIRNGIIPRTGDANSVSPRGAFSDAHPGSQSAVDLGNCGSFMPYSIPQLDEDFLDHLQSILTGGPSSIYNGRCGGLDYGDGIARGYVTADVVNDCTLLTPCETGYFHDGSFVAGSGIGEYDNVIWGDWYMINYGENFAQGDTLVHVEAADPADLAGQDTLNGTFWGRCGLDLDVPFVPLWPDLRETLPTTFATRFYQNAAFEGGTDLLVWRDSLFQYLIPDLIPGYGDFAHAGFNCNIGPLWFPLTQRQSVTFDEQENPEALCTVSPCPDEDILFPAEAQRVPVPDLEVVPESGWLYFNLNQFPIFTDVANTAASSQAWITAVHSAEGRFSAGLPAIQLDNYCDNSSILIGPSGPNFPTPEVTYNYMTSYYYYGGLGPLRGEKRSGASAPTLKPKFTQGLGD